MSYWQSIGKCWGEVNQQDMSITSIPELINIFPYACKFVLKEIKPLTFHEDCEIGTLPSLFIF